jgi:hypothetical protein
MSASRAHPSSSFALGSGPVVALAAAAAAGSGSAVPVVEVPPDVEPPSAVLGLLASLPTSASRCCSISCETARAQAYR